jgi:hypothetical protein
MTRSLALAACVLAAVSLPASPARAQYALRATVVASGAADATGGGLRLRATAGEPAVGRVAGGTYAVGQGFWYAAALDSGPAGPLVDLTLTPIDPPPPVVIARGGRLRYRADFAVASNGPSQFQYWAEATLPNNQVRFLFGPVSVTAVPGTTVTRNLTQNIPQNVPLGNYVFRMKVGTYPGTVYDEDSFPVTIVAAGALLAGPAPGRDLPTPEDTRATGGRRALGRDVQAEASRLTTQGARRAADDARETGGLTEARLATEWLAWDEDGTLLVSGLVQDLRRIAFEGTAFDGADPAAAGPGDNAEAEQPGDAAGRDGGTEATEAAPPSAATPTEVPVAVFLAPPFPNPFDARTTLRFALPEMRPTRLAVYDVHGRRVALLLEGDRTAGWHEATFDGRGLASGLYVVRLEAGGQVRAQRLTLLR